MGIIIGFALLWFPRPVRAAAVCSSEYNYEVRVLGGSRFEMISLPPLLDQMQWGGARCAAREPERAIVPVGALHNSAWDDSTPPMGASVIIVIDDFGYRDDWVVEGFLSLESALAIAVIPGHQFSSDIAARAHRRGYEVLLHMPMQALRYVPGEIEYRLTTEMSNTEIGRRVRRAIAEIPQAVGMNNHQGSAATGDVRVMNTVRAELLQQGMFFLDSFTSPDSVALESMRAGGVAATRRDLFLDSVDDIGYVLKQLRLLGEIAAQQGYAVGIGHVRANTLIALQEALPQMKASGQSFMFLSSVVGFTP